MLVRTEDVPARPPRVVYAFGDFEFIEGDRVLLRRGGRVPVTPKALDTLAILLAARGRLVTKDELLRGVWPDTFVEENSLTRNVSVLRKALAGDASDQQFIETVPKSGYRFIAPITERHSSGVASATSEVAGVVAVRDGRRAPVRLIAAAVVVFLAAGGLWLLWQARRAPVAPPAASDTIHQIAVLPLHIIGAANGIEHLAIGIPDTIITRLANMRTLRVRSTRTILPVTGADPAKAGLALAVDHVLAGTLQAVGGTARINLQLVRTADGIVVWGDAFELRVDQLMSLQDDAIADRVAQALHVRTTATERERAFRRYTDQADAYALYLRGRALLANYTDATMTQAIEQFEHALRLDPQYALARAGLATALAFFSVRYAYEDEARIWAGRAETEARQALQQDPELAEAHLALASAAGTVYRSFDWNLVLAEAATALRLNPNLDLAHTTRARALFHLGLFDSAEQALQRAEAGAPATVESARIRVLLALHRGRFTEALSQAEHLARRTDAPAVQSYIAMASYYLGDVARATQILSNLRRGGRPDIRAQAFLAAIEAAQGNRTRARGIVATITAQSYMDHHVATYLAAASTQLADYPGATRWLRAAADTGFACYPWFDIDPLLRPLRADAGFNAMMRDGRASFEQAEKQHGQP